MLILRSRTMRGFSFPKGVIPEWQTSNKLRWSPTPLVDPTTWSPGSGFAQTIFGDNEDVIVNLSKTVIGNNTSNPTAFGGRRVQMTGGYRKGRIEMIGATEEQYFEGLVVDFRQMQFANARAINGGSGYVVGDIVAPVGGTFTVQGLLRVTSIGGGGAVTGLASTGTGTNVGNYSVRPPIETGVTGGSGSGLIVNCIMYEADAFHAGGKAGRRVTAVAVASGGAGYVVGEYLPLNGGTTFAVPLVDVGVQAVLRVDAVSGGAVTAVSVYQSGSYNTPPSGTQGHGATFLPNAARSAGAGSGATFSITSVTAQAEQTYPRTLLQNIIAIGVVGQEDTTGGSRGGHVHADIFQPAGPLGEVCIHRLAGDSAYQGFFVPAQYPIGSITTSFCQIKPNDQPTDLDPNGRYLFWPRDTDQSGAGGGGKTLYPFTFGPKVYTMEKTGTNWGTQNVWPPAGHTCDGVPVGCIIAADGQSATFPPGSNINGTLLRGTPETDFVSISGIWPSYVSPGYSAN